MLKALSVRIWICVESLWRSRATVLAANSAMLIVCLSGCDLISMCVVVCVSGLTMDAPNVGFPDFWDPSMYMKLSGSHAAEWSELEVWGSMCVGSGMFG